MCLYKAPKRKGVSNESALHVWHCLASQHYRCANYFSLQIELEFVFFKWMVG